MTAATVVEVMETFSPGLEVAKVTFTDGYTYVAKKLGRIVGGHLTSASRAGGYISISGTTVTLHCGSASGDTGYLTLYGQL